MKISKRLKAAESTVSFNVEEICNRAQQLEDSGEYMKAAQIMGRWWPGIGIRPQIDNLSVDKKATVLSRVGALSGWLGSMQQIQGSQEKAKDLISEGASLFETAHDWDNWAEARSDLAICYWREGAFNEARIILQDVLGGKLEFSPILKGKILLRLVTVETSAKHFEVASFLLNQVDALIKDKKNPLLLGKFYFYRALITRHQAENEGQPNLLISSIENYCLAAKFYQQAGHLQFVTSTKINLGYVFLFLDRYTEAHIHFDAALESLSNQKDKRLAASVYDSKARTFIGQGNLTAAELAALTSVNMLKEGGENAVLAESLTTFGVVLSRGGNVDYAIRIFDEAKETALSVGDLESAGNAVLTQIEELRASLAPVVIRELYLEANDLLQKSSKISSINRLRVIAAWQFEIDNPKSPLKDEKYFDWKNFSLPQTVLSYEREFILKALNESEGRVTRAAKLLGISHQSLSLIMRKRHRDLQQYSVKRKPRDC